MLRGEKARDEVGHQRSQRKMSRKVRSESYARRFPLATAAYKTQGSPRLRARVCMRISVVCWTRRIAEEGGEHGGGQGQRPEVTAGSKGNRN